MRAVGKYLVGGIAIAALAAAAPAAAQYYPGYGNPGYGYGYGNPYGGNVVGQVLNDVLGSGYGYNGVNSQRAVNQCAAAVQARLNGGNGYNGYGYNGYGYNGYSNGSGARVLGISRVEPRSNGGLLVRGVANSGRYYGGYGYNGSNGYNSQARVDLTWKCKVDYRGFVSDIDINRAESNYGYGGYSPYNNNSYDYSQYGYRRY